jgi:hypothetical protein
LKKRLAPKEDIKYIEYAYPNGVEISTILLDQNVDASFRHWLRKYVEMSEEELALYHDVCKIKESSGVWNSVEILGSQNVIDSETVTDSTNIFQSKEIEKSSDIVRGESVINSKQIFRSFAIEDSSKVLMGKNVNCSQNICRSSMVVKSKNVLDSSMIFNSTEIVGCQNSQEAHFCSDCKNIKNSLFCHGLDNVEYHLFNKPIAPELYEIIAKQYKRYFIEDVNFVAEWPEDLLVDAEIYVCKHQEWYKDIPKKFWKWVRTLPGVDSMLVYDISMCPTILVDEP